MTEYALGSQLTKTGKDATLISTEPPTPPVRSAHQGGRFYLIMTRQPALAPTSIMDQIKALADRGMAVPDVDFAARCLTHIGYYRLVSYWLPFQSSPGTAAPFHTGTSFNRVMTRYMFDQRLRSLLLEALSYFEISVRNQWSLHVVLNSSKGEFAHLDAGLFDPTYYNDNLQELRRNYDQVRGQGGTGFQRVGIWDIAPTISFGNLSRWYASLVDKNIRQSISINYGVDEATLTSILRHLTSVRNTCAHHEPLWNEKIRTGLRIPRRLRGSREIATAFNKSADRKIYNALVIIVHLMEIITPNGDWPERLLALLAVYNPIPYHNMGFPAGWREFTIWQKYQLPQNDAEPRTP